MSSVAADPALSTSPASAAPADRGVVPAVTGVVMPVLLGTWFGGLVALILFVSVLFVKARRVAVDAAPVLFSAFERYQLALAAVSLLTAVVWRLAARSAWTTAVVATALAATGLSALQIGVITPRINAARDVDHATFDRFHHYASMNYTTLAGFVLSGFVVALLAGRGGRGQARFRGAAGEA